jgi:hypothetical protein
MRFVWEAENGGSFNHLDFQMMDDIAKALGRVRGVHIAFAFFDVSTGRRIRSYGPFGPASPELQKLIDVELAENEDVPA